MGDRELCGMTRKRDKRVCWLTKGHRGRHIFMRVPVTAPSAALASSMVGLSNSVESLMHTFVTGAKRSELKPRYDLIPSIGLRRLSARYAMGLKYGEFNWYQGLPMSDTLNHIIDHLLIYRDKIRAIRLQFPDDVEAQRTEIKRMAALPDDDLAGAAWGCIALMWLEENEKLVL